MSTYIVTSIIILLSALACYAFISQAIEKRLIQKHRILMALKTKHRNFVHLINGFPEYFLPSEILYLIYRELINICQQLRSVEPNNSQYHDELLLYSNQLSTLTKANSTKVAVLENLQQMKDVRQHLQEVQSFVLQQESLKNINKVQAKIYLEQIKQLALQITVESYIYNAKHALQNGKVRLAIHYFTLAKKLLITENSTHTFDKQIAHLENVLIKLAEKAMASDNPASKESYTDSTSKEWAEFDKKEHENADWKKKQIYD